MFDFLFNTIRYIVDGVRSLIDFISGSLQVFSNWNSFVPAFLSSFLLISIGLTVLLVILKRANK